MKGVSVEFELANFTVYIADAISRVYLQKDIDTNGRRYASLSAEKRQISVKCPKINPSAV